jgi:hypothetical protein
MESKRTLIIDPEAFCFGPVSTTLNVIREMRMRRPGQGLKVILLGTLTSRQLGEAGAGLVDEIIECDPSVEEDLLAHRALIEASEFYVSSGNFNSVELLLRNHVNVKIIFIDTLFWMWDALNPIIGLVHRYYVQDFWGVRERVAAMELGRENVKIVQPLINMAGGEKPRKEPILLINFGGIENIYSRGRTYHAKNLLKLLLDVVRTLPAFAGHRKVVCGGGGQILEMKAEFEDPGQGIEVGCLPQEEYLGVLARCEFFLSLPGLTSFMESVYHRAKTFLLLPQNYSQVLQLRLVSRHCPGVDGVNWNAFPGLPEIREYERELEALEKVHECNRLFFASPALMEAYAISIRKFLASGPGTGIAMDQALPFFSRQKNGPAEIAEDLLAEMPGSSGRNAPAKLKQASLSDR